MSAGPSFWEFLLLCAIGLIVLGPKRLPQVAQQIGTWVGHARRMTRTLRRQLEEELELDKSMNVRPAPPYQPPRSETYSPMHGDAGETPADAAPAGDEPPGSQQPDISGSDTRAVDSEQRKQA